MKGITAAIVNYNTTELTQAAIRSLWKHHPDCKVVVMDNSDTRPFDGVDGENGRLAILDNTKGQFANFDHMLEACHNKIRSNNGYASAKHAFSVQMLINIIRKPILLMDSDVLIRKPLTPLCNPACYAVGEVSVNPKLNDAPRLLPILCYINVPMIKEAGIQYFNPNYMWALSNVHPNNRYDTGAWFLRELEGRRKFYIDTPIEPYALHFGHGSWKEKDAKEWLREHRDLWE
jgi:hypothetical protein